MSWSIEEHIGECRPWPAQVVVYRGETDECLAYVSGEVADQLKAENAKLRDGYGSMSREHSQTIVELSDAYYSIDQLKAENAELRELVRIMKNCADECGDCDTCPINGEPGVLNPWLDCDSLRDRMRELGVEVDDG